MGQLTSHFMISTHCQQLSNNYLTNQQQYPPTGNQESNIPTSTQLPNIASKSTATAMVTPTQYEFSVNMTCGSCEQSIRDVVSQLPNTKLIHVEASTNQVLVETVLPSSQVHAQLESTGMTSVLKGMGSVLTKAHHGAAVSIVKGPDVSVSITDTAMNIRSVSLADEQSTVDSKRVFGLVRFLQVDRQTCVIDGSFDGLPEGDHALIVHELGDLSDGWNSTGGVYTSDDNSVDSSTAFEHAVGNLGVLHADATGHSDVRLEHARLKVWDIIGRTLVLHKLNNTKNGHPSQVSKVPSAGIAWGIIARSAGLFGNKKTVCECSGKNLWQEREYAKQNPFAPV